MQRDKLQLPVTMQDIYLHDIAQSLRLLLDVMLDKSSALAPPASADVVELKGIEQKATRRTRD